MAKYVLLYSGGGMPESPEQQAAVLKAWEAWYGQLGSATVDGGNPFTPAVKHINPGGQVGDGPIGTQASGYSIIEADSMDAAVAMAQGCPILQGNGQLTVYETFNAMG
jgi:hypothetical protein